MKKIMKLFLSLCLGTILVSIPVNAEENEPTVCHFVLNEDGELVEVCDVEARWKDIPYCTTECWGA